MLKEIREDINGKINRHDIDKILQEDEQVKKSFSEMATRNEMQARIEMVMQDYTKKLKDKISTSMFAKNISTYEVKM